jgi:prophage regulatory protein
MTNVTKNTKAKTKSEARRLTQRVQLRTLVPITGSRLLSRAEVLDRVGVSYPTLWAWMRDGKFPRSRQRGTSHVAWLESEVEEWIQGLPVRQLKGDASILTGGR